MSEYRDSIIKIIFDAEQPIGINEIAATLERSEYSVRNCLLSRLLGYDLIRTKVKSRPRAKLYSFSDHTKTLIQQEIDSRKEIEQNSSNKPRYYINKNLICIHKAFMIAA